MGAFFYSNKWSDGSIDKVKSILTSRGHKEFTTIIQGSSVALSTPKICVNNINTLKFNDLNGGGYAIGIGTYFYNGCFAEKALHEIYKCSDIDKLIADNEIYGHYAFLINKGGRTWVFNDRMGSLRLFIYNKDGQFTISSSMLATAVSLDKVSFDKIKVGGFIANSLGREISPFANVDVVDASYYLVINSNGSIDKNKREFGVAPRVSSLPDAVSLTKNLFNNQVEQIKSIKNEKVSIECTGGLDSRLVCANLKSNGINFDFINYPLFGPDREMSEMLSKGLGRKLLVQTNISLKDTELEDNIGEFDFCNDFYRQYPNKRWQIINRLQFSGARGECISTPPTIEICENNNCKPTIANIYPHLVGGTMMTKESFAKFSDWLEGGACEWIGVDKNDVLTEEQQSLFVQYVYGNAGDYMYNSACQAHIYFYQIFNEWHFNRTVANIAFDVKAGRKVTLALIKDIDPELASYPFVSHRRTKGKSVNEVSELPIHQRSFNGIKQMMPKWMLNTVYEKLNRVFNKQRFNYIDFDYYKDILKIEEMSKYPNLYSDKLNRVYSVEVIRKTLNII